MMSDRPKICKKSLQIYCDKSKKCTKKSLKKLRFISSKHLKTSIYIYIMNVKRKLIFKKRKYKRKLARIVQLE